MTITVKTTPLTRRHRKSPVQFPHLTRRPYFVFAIELHLSFYCFSHPGHRPKMADTSKCFNTFARFPYSGGVFSALCPQVHLIGMISFMENTAVLDGGAISLTDPNDFHVLGTSFLSNKAGSGGAVSLATTGPTTGGFDRCRFDSNDASDGGALYLNTADSGDTENPTFIRDSVFRNNLAGEGSQICGTFRDCRVQLSHAAIPVDALACAEALCRRRLELGEERQHLQYAFLVKSNGMRFPYQQWRVWQSPLKCI